MLTLCPVDSHWRVVHCIGLCVGQVQSLGADTVSCRQPLKSSTLYRFVCGAGTVLWCMLTLLPVDSHWRVVHCIGLCVRQVQSFGSNTVSCRQPLESSRLYRFVCVCVYKHYFFVPYISRVSDQIGMSLQ